MRMHAVDAISQQVDQVGGRLAWFPEHGVFIASGMHSRRDKRVGAASSPLPATGTGVGR